MKQVVKSFLRNKKLCNKDMDFRVSESKSERSLRELDNVVPYLLTANKIIPEPSGVGGGASADAPTVGHRWQSDTDGSLIQLFKKKKKG